jgi:hypothetical protein
MGIMNAGGLVYDCQTGVIRTFGGRLMGTAPTIDAVGLAFPNTVIRVKNIKSIVRK